MQKIQEQAKDTSGNCERRLNPRRKLMPMAYIELGQDNGGIVLNVSEGGLAIQSAMVLRSPGLPDARFHLPGSDEWIKADARIARLSESKKEAGLQFVRISDDAKARIRAWVAADEPHPEGFDRNANDTAPGPVSPEATKKLEESQPLSLATGTLFGNANSWDTLGPTPVPSTWVDREIFGGSDVTASEQDTGWLRFAITAVALGAVSYFVGVNLGPTPLHRWFVSTVQQLNWVKPTPTGSQALASENTSVAASMSTPTPPSVAAAPAESRVEEKQVLEQAAPVRQPVQQPARTPVANELIQAQPQNPESKAVFEAATGLSAQEKPLSRTAAQKPNDARRISAVRSDNGILSLSEHTILVTAPGAGSPDFYVNLPEEAISASPGIAVTARRSLRITARYVYPQAERVRIGQMVSRTEPYYPVEALNEKVEGIVQVHALLGPDGDVTNVRAVNGGPRALESAALAAIRTWRYEPTLIDGRPVATEADITVTFRLP